MWSSCILSVAASSTASPIASPTGRTGRGSWVCAMPPCGVRHALEVHMSAQLFRAFANRQYCWFKQRAAATLSS